MNPLLAHLNSLSVPEQRLFADACGTSAGYLRKACHANQKIGAEICVAIERETAGAISRQDLRPNDWHKVWPELIAAKPKRKTRAA